MIEKVIFGRYKILKLLGKGGVGSVYEGLHLKLNLPVAIKCIPKERSALPIMSREVEILKCLKHPGLPTIYDVDEDEDNFYLVQEFIKGRTLTEQLEQSGPIGGLDVIEIALKLMDVLEYLHFHSDGPIIHRDVKPDNIMLTEQGEAILIDFGIARTYNASLPGDTAYLGTAGFAAPEQYGRGQSDARTDIFAFGMTLYVLLTGDLDFSRYQGYSWEKEMNSGDPYTDRILVEIIKKATQFHPEDRFDSIKSMKGLLEARDKSKTEVLNSRITRPLGYQKGNERIEERTPVIKRIIVGIKGSRSGVGVTYACVSLAVALKELGYSVAVVVSNRSTVFSSLYQHFLGNLSKEGLADCTYKIDGITFYNFEPQKGMGNLLVSNCDYYLLDCSADESLHQEWIRAHIRLMLVSSALWYLKENEVVINHLKAFKDIRYIYQPVDKRLLKSILADSQIAPPVHEVMPFICNPFNTSEEMLLFTKHILGIGHDKKRKWKWPFIRSKK